ncbi:carbohydrate ABC transporter permease [Kribbella sp. CA-294648]|uniref:carbohydrate ABC transporter permease n=1 Tax=Kribbella sp. CA-294648 TaxID=3239948 RepID=UPI003D8CE1F0
MRRYAAATTTRVLAIVVAALYVMPLWYVVTTAAQPPGGRQGELVPSGVRPENFAEALASAPFATFFINSAIVTIGSTAVQVALSCMAGYALARLPFRGRGGIFVLLVALLVVPPEVTMVPLFILTTHVPLAGGNNILGTGGTGLLDTYLGLMVPHLASALSIFLMRQFYLSMPEELADSARIDGASEWRIMWQIFTPLAWPAVVTVAIFAFQSAWNDFLWPLVIIRSNEMRTLQLGLTVFFQENSTQWTLLMASVIVISLPVVLLFLLGQRTFQQGVAAGAVKE